MLAVAGKPRERDRNACPCAKPSPAFSDSAMVAALGGADRPGSHCACAGGGGSGIMGAVAWTGVGPEEGSRLRLGCGPPGGQGLPFPIFGKGPFPLSGLLKINKQDFLPSFSPLTSAEGSDGPRKSFPGTRALEGGFL